MKTQTHGAFCRASLMIVLQQAPSTECRGTNVVRPNYWFKLDYTEI